MSLTRILVLRAVTFFVAARHHLQRPIRRQSIFFRGDSAHDKAGEFTQQFAFHRCCIVFEPERHFDKGVGSADDRVLIIGRLFFDLGKPPVIAGPNDKPVDRRTRRGAVFTDILRAWPGVCMPVA